MLKRNPVRFPELTYANPNDPKLKQWFIRRVEGLSGRDHFADMYAVWRSDVVGKSSRVMGGMLDRQLTKGMVRFLADLDAAASADPSAASSG